ncbi:protein NO VEIN domain-containing protein [Neobacillus sp. D3-1R]|uniref:protein NO VEIN domain-containing protein n=1 Tax=Neobacillus sp. D3-1R TaxID=3445778 RepID=UPI003FA102AB
MTLYSVPSQYFFRLHHPRPRFKNDIENVLIYFATEITAIGRKPIRDFVLDLDFAIKKYPGNLTKSQKTINNWRTEIDALFCFIELEGRFLKPSHRAIELANNQDLVKFFKLFCYHFQYPGGFLKQHVNLEYLRNGINFRPCSYILKMLSEVEEHEGVRAGISKSEATHCIFNDLRVTRDGRPEKDTWKLIKENRDNGMEYDWTGDVIRYAGDILDYMVQANLLVRHASHKYYINRVESIAIRRFINPTNDLFNYYDEISDVSTLTLREVKELDAEWVTYFNTQRDEGFFDTDILALVAESASQYRELKSLIDLDRVIAEGGLSTTGSIGSIGESLILNHEKKRIVQEGRPDLEHLIKLIPTQYAIGYDINSREIDETHRNIEVKTTSSATPLSFMRFHLTPNEWSAAESNKERYYVYRLMVTKGAVKLITIQDPVGNYKLGNLSATPRNGMDIIFDPNRCGKEETLKI